MINTLVIMCHKTTASVKPNFCYNIDGIVQNIGNSSALAMELRLSCTNPSILNLSTARSNPIRLTQT